MNKKFTKLIAALALLVFMTSSMVGWGQTRADGDTHEFSQSLSQLLNNNASISSINIAAQSYAVKKVTVVGSYNKSYDPAVTIAVTVGGTSWGTQQVGGNGSFSKDFIGTATVGTIVISFTNETGSGTGHGTFNVTNVILTEGVGITYTVTLDDDNTELTQPSAGASVTLPTRDDSGDYSFEGWSETNVEDETTTAPTIIPAGEYTPTADITLYPVYTRTAAASGPTNVTANVTIADYASAHGWVSGTAYQPLEMDANISIGGTISGNNFKYYSSDNSWRFYTGGSFTISANNGATLSSVTLTFSGGLSYNNNDITSGTAFNVSGTSATISCTANAKITVISVSYTITGGTTTYYWSWPVIYTDPIINATNPEALAYNATGGEFGYSITNPATGVSLVATSNSDWITNVAVDETNSKVTFSTLTNPNYDQRAGTITLSYTGATDKVITITQNTHPHPIINANDVTLVYNVTSGEISYTLSNPALDGSFEVIEDLDWISNATVNTNNSKVTFDCEANPSYLSRQGTVTIKYTYDSGLTKSKDVTVTQDGDPDAVDNISSITQVGTSYKVRGTVVAINARGFIIGDGTGYVYTYLGENNMTEAGIEVSDILTVYGEMGSHNNVLQFTSSAVREEATSSNYNNTPVVTNITAVPDYTQGNYLSTYLRFEGALEKSNSNYFITLGEEQIQIAYPTSAQGDALTALDDKRVVVKGYFAAYNTNDYFTVMLESVEEVPSHTLTLGDHANVNEFFVFDDPNGYPIEFENDEYQIYEGVTVYVSIDKIADCYLFGGVSVTHGDNQTVETTELTHNVYYSFVMPAADATLAIGTTDADSYTLTVAGLDNVSYTYFQTGNSNSITLDENYQADICEQVSIEIVNLAATSGNILQSVTYSYDGETFAITPENGIYTFTMPSKDVTLTFVTTEAPQPATYTLVTSQSQLMPGKHYIIVSVKDEQAYAMGVQNSNNRRGVEVFKQSNDSYNVLVGNEDVKELIISGDNTNYFTIYDKTVPGYLYAASTTGNNAKSYLKTESELDNDNRGKWSISFGVDNTATIISQGISSRNVIMYNGDGTNSLFNCYSSGSNYAATYLYEKNGDTDLELYSNTTLSSANTITVPANGILTVNAGTLSNTNPAYLIIEDGGQLIISSAVAATVQKTIVAHGETTANGGWNFIASPINSNSLDPATTGLGMITDNLGNGASETTATYDLYKFVENPTDNDKEWKNYRNATFNLANGQGYLYASKEGTTLNFTGSINPCNQNVEVNLDFTTGAEFAGWNLVGNPFTFNAYVNRSYYKMNDDGSAILADVQASGTTIAPCMGIMVHVGQTDQSVTFSKEPPTTSPSNGNVNIAVMQANERGASATTVDKAIVSFNEGNELPKFYFMEQNANLYIPQGEKEYAIATSEGQGEMPLNFRANTDGQYVLTVNPEGVEMNYLHLIDNMTGNDIDLLQTPSYSFNAKTTDYESRFRLVFAANNESGVSASSTTFAFYSNGNWMVNNEGEATLQVIDVMGRVLSNQTISGTAELSLNQQPGVYVLRLVNGNDVKTQKIVVR